MQDLPTKILVTGADGFIGRHVLRDLNRRALPAIAATRHGGEVEGTPGIAIGDLGAPPDWSGMLEGVSHVIHLAGRAHILRETETDPEAAFHRINAEATRQLADAAKAAGVRSFVYLSSIAVYDPALTHLAAATNEDPKTGYGRSKLAGETAIRQVANEQMTWSILRPPLVYGPGVGARFLQLLKLASSRLPLPLGGVRNSRSLLYVGNLTDALIMGLDHPEMKNRSFLISDGEDLSTPELVKLLGAGMGKEPMLIKVPKSFCDLGATLTGLGTPWRKLTGTLTLDTTELARATGWRAPASLSDGLRDTAKWYARAPSK